MCGGAQLLNIFIMYAALKMCRIAGVLFHSLLTPTRCHLTAAAPDTTPARRIQVRGPDLLAQLGVGLYRIDCRVQLSNIAGRQRR